MDRLFYISELEDESRNVIYIRNFDAESDPQLLVFLKSICDYSGTVDRDNNDTLVFGIKKLISISAIQILTTKFNLIKTDFRINLYQ